MDFFNLQAGINEDLSNEIFTSLFEEGVININNFLTEKFNPEIKFKISG